jgi:coenzyme F420 hydrogenase subunit beta
MTKDEHIKDVFVVTLSFFCAGAPSIHANESLLNKMGTSKDRCISLRYRGDGWPGFATAVDVDGKTHKLDYRTVWRDTLGRDIRPICRFCIDGIGEFADIVCFDAWYMGSDKKPLFKEADGRNGVFCRSNEGLRIFTEACKTGYINSSDYRDYADELCYIQKYQYTRRTTMPSTILAMKLFFKSTPSYPFTFMMSLMSSSTIKSNISRFWGTIKRIINGRIN